MEDISHVAMLGRQGRVVEKSFPWLGRKEEGGLRRDEGRSHERAPGRGERGVVHTPKSGEF